MGVRTYVLKCVGYVNCGSFDNCVGVLVICVLVFIAFLYCFIYVYLFLFVSSVRTTVTEENTSEIIIIIIIITKRLVVNSYQSFERTTQLQFYLPIFKGQIYFFIVYRACSTTLGSTTCHVTDYLHVFLCY